MKPGFSLLQIGVKQCKTAIFFRNPIHARLKLKSWICLDIEILKCVWRWKTSPPNMSRLSRDVLALESVAHAIIVYCCCL